MNHWLGNWWCIWKFYRPSYVVAIFLQTMKRMFEGILFCVREHIMQHFAYTKIKKRQTNRRLYGVTRCNNSLQMLLYPIPLIITCIPIFILIYSQLFTTIFEFWSIKISLFYENIIIIPCFIHIFRS